MKRFSISGLLLCLAVVLMAQGATYDRAFEQLNDLPWKKVFADSGKDNWRAHWVNDGARSSVENTPQGMVYSAGAVRDSDADHTVLWTRQSFEGDVKIEYDFTRIDTVNNYVNIIYIQATGSGRDEYERDILKWTALRAEPYMHIYFDNMHTYHISYAVSGANEPGVDTYIRGRRYMPEWGEGLKNTAMTPEYANPGLFEAGVTYHITIIKKGKVLYMNVRNEHHNQTFYMSAEAFPAITEGRIGLRQMCTRVSRYHDFKVFELR